MTSGCKALALSRVPFASSASAVPSAFTVLKLSGQGVNFQKKGPYFKSRVTWQLELELVHQADAGSGPIDVVRQLCDCEPVPWLIELHGVSSSNRAIISVGQDNSMHNK